MRLLRIIAVIGIALSLLWLALNALLMGIYKGKVRRTLGDLFVIGRAFEAVPDSACQEESACLSAFSASLSANKVRLEQMRDSFNQPYTVLLISASTAADLFPRCSTEAPPRRFHLLAWSRGLDSRKDSAWQCGVVPPWDPIYNDIVFLDGVAVQTPAELTREPTRFWFMLRRWLLRPGGA